MKRCKKCCMPNTRPDHVFVDNVCPACRNREPKVDWESREQELLQLLDKHDGRCIVPSSGGKDSTYQVVKLLELGADPLVVTASTCHLTPIGRLNIDNLAKYADTIEVSPNKTVRRTLNRLGLEMVGDISWPEHAAIFSTPFRIAVENNISLIIYGENPQNQYGGPKGTSEARTMTQRWTHEFGGFLGLRPSDFVGLEGITERDMHYYTPPNNVGMKGIEAHFLGQYIKWDSRENARIAMQHGMTQQRPCNANWWEWENCDNAQTGIHDHMMYRKYGYGRGATQLAVDIREGRVRRKKAMQWILKHDGLFPFTYMDVELEEVLDAIGVPLHAFKDILDQFTNWELFYGEQDWRPLLK